MTTVDCRKNTESGAISIFPSNQMVEQYNRIDMHLPAFSL